MKMVIAMLMLLGCLFIGCINVSKAMSSDCSSMPGDCHSSFIMIALITRATEECGYEMRDVNGELQRATNCCSGAGKGHWEWLGEASDKWDQLVKEDCGKEQACKEALKLFSPFLQISNTTSKSKSGVKNEGDEEKKITVPQESQIDQSLSPKKEKPRTKITAEQIVQELRSKNPLSQGETLSGTTQGSTSGTEGQPALSKSAIPPLPDLPNEVSAALKAMIDGAWNGELDKIERAKAKLQTGLIASKCPEKLAARAKNATGLQAVSREEMLDAVKNFHAAYVLCPADIEVLNNLGFALTKVGDYDNAEKALLNSLSLAPTHTNSWYSLAQVFSIKGDVNSAVGCFLNGFRFSKNQKRSTEALHNLANNDPSPSTQESARVALQKLGVGQVLAGDQISKPEEHELKAEENHNKKGWYELKMNHEDSTCEESSGPASSIQLAKMFGGNPIVRDFTDSSGKIVKVEVSVPCSDGVLTYMYYRNLQDCKQEENKRAHQYDKYK